MLRVVEHRRDRTLSKWSAVVVARAGHLGTLQTLATLESLISSWTDAVDDWSVVVLAPDDEHLRHLAASLSGDVDIRWGEDDPKTVVDEQRRAGRTPWLFTAGDAVPAADPERPTLVPLVASPEALQAHLASSAAVPPDLPFAWDLEPRLDLKHDLVVLLDDAVSEAPRLRARTTVGWLLGGSASVGPAELARLDLVVTDDPDLVQALPNAAYAPRGGCHLEARHQRLAPKSLDLAVVDLSAGSGDLGRWDPPVETSAVVHRVPTGLSRPDASAWWAGVLTPARFVVLLGGPDAGGRTDEHVVDAWRTGTVPVLPTGGAGRSVTIVDGLSFSEGEALDTLSGRLDEAEYRARLPHVVRDFDRASTLTVRERSLVPLLRPYLALARRPA